MNTMKHTLQPIVNKLSNGERADIARLLIHANELYQAYNSVSRNKQDKQTSLDHALKLITQVIDADSDNIPAMNLLGRIELDKGNISTAKSYFEKCLDHSPDNTQYLANKGYMHIMADEPELAISYFQKALDIDSSYKNAFLGIARAYEALRQYDVAYLHYRSLINHGYDSKTVLQGMLNCCAHLNIDHYEPKLEADLFALFAQEDLAHERLHDFAAKLISKKYDLENPNATINLVDVAQDPLIYYSLLYCSLPDPHVEEFITLLRQSILLECTDTGTLRDDIQLLAIAIAVYSERGNYAMIESDIEAERVLQLDQQLTEYLQQEWKIDEVVGALVLVGMYKAFFSTRYAVNLTALSLAEWPDALQPMMNAGLYRRGERESFKQQFPEKQNELLLGKEDYSSPFPRNMNIGFFNQSSLKVELVKNFNAELNELPDRLLLLVAGSDASQRALEYAANYSDIDVLAVEQSLENLAECHLLAEEKALNNVVFWPVSMAKCFLNDGNQIHFASISAEDKTMDEEFIKLVKDNLMAKGVLNIKLAEPADSASVDIQTLINKQGLKSTTANIKALRSTILSDKDSAYWSNLIHEEYFYSVDGCRDVWFNQENKQEFLDNIVHLLDAPSWALSKVLNHYGKTISTTIAEKNLQKIAKEQSKHSDYSLYFVKQ